MKRAFGSILTGMLLLTVLQSNGLAQPEPEKQTINAADGWPLKITYYPSPGDRESPVVIMIPEADGINSLTQSVYKTLATRLQAKKFAVVTVDLRKHGDSVPADVDENDRRMKLVPTDYQAMAGMDLVAVKNFLLTEHEKEKLNIRKLAIVSAGKSCVVSNVFAAADWAQKPWNDAPVPALRTPRGQDVQALVMLSPEYTLRGMTTHTQAMRFLSEPGKNIAVRIFRNETNRVEKSTTDRVFKLFDLKDKDTLEARKVISVPNPQDSSGDRLLELRGGKGTIELIELFLTEFVEKRETPWRTRKSKLER